MTGLSRKKKKTIQLIKKKFPNLDYAEYTENYDRKQDQQLIKKVSNEWYLAVIPCSGPICTVTTPFKAFLPIRL